jgi:hypothetical protein
MIGVQVQSIPYSRTMQEPLLGLPHAHICVNADR